MLLVMRLAPWASIVSIAGIPSKMYYFGQAWTGSAGSSPATGVLMSKCFWERQVTEGYGYRSLASMAGQFLLCRGICCRPRCFLRRELASGAAQLKSLQLVLQTTNKGEEVE